MTYKVVDIEGVGEIYAEKLIAAGIKTDAELLEKCAKPAGRKALEEATGISGAGVDTVKELKHRVAANLAAKLQEVNEQKKLVRRVPVESEIQAMIDQAKELPGKMEY